MRKSNGKSGAAQVQRRCELFLYTVILKARSKRNAMNAMLSNSACRPTLSSIISHAHGRHFPGHWAQTDKYDMHMDTTHIKHKHAACMWLHHKPRAAA